MRFEIYVNGRLLLCAKYIADTEWFIQNCMSVGQSVRVKDRLTGRSWENTEAEAILNSLQGV